MRRIGTVFALVCCLALVTAAAAAGAPAKPAATTGGAANLTPISALLSGTVDPNESPTTYTFQYGPTKAYGSATPPVDAGSGAAPVNVAIPVIGLAPATTYHYRLVAQNALGTANGADKTLHTPPQPLGATLGATPNPVRFGSGTTLGGVLTGTNSAGRPVVLQANAFPFTQGFTNVGNAQVTNPQGAFAFAILAIPVNTQYRVLLPDRPEVVSPIVSVGVALRVSTHVSAHRVRSGRRVGFSGTIRPARDGTPISIQRRSAGRWITVVHTIAHHSSSSQSRYAKRVRIGRGGSYRVLARVIGGDYVSGTGSTVQIRRR